jgi:hypothetical protein
VEARKHKDKFPRISNQLFEPVCTFTIHAPNHPLTSESVKAMLLGISQSDHWYAPNDDTSLEDKIVVKTASGGGPERITIEFPHERTALRERQVDAYLRHVHQLGNRLFQMLKPFGCWEVGVNMNLWAHVATIRVGSHNAGIKLTA